MLKVLHKYHASKAYVVSITKEDIYNVFPEIKENEIKKKVFITKGGEYVDVPEKVISKSEI